jgi:hypothetical protein
VIAVVGRLGAGYATEVARRVARREAAVELVATVPTDPRGDASLAELAAAGVGHAAVLRSPAPGLEPADLDLALRYLPDVRVIVLADAGTALEVAAADAAAWSGAALIVLSHGEAAGATAEADDSAAHPAIRLQAPEGDPDGAFAGVVAELATRLDTGTPPEAAWRETASALGLERVGPRR